MKKVIALFLTIVVLLSCLGCGKAEEQPINMEPKVSQMKAICELAVMECYYHNVAKFYEENAEKGFLGIGSKDKHFWIEYSGVVKLGIDVSLVNITVNDTQITITLPEAQVLGCKVNAASLSENSFIVDKDSAEITADDEVKAFAEAQAQLEQTAISDKALLANAQQRAQSLLEDYITNIGNTVGKTYSISWVYLRADGTTISDEVTEPVTE